MRLVALCRALSKVDGLKVTRVDREMAVEYAKIVDEEMDLIARSGPTDLSASKLRPSTAVSTFEWEEEGLGKSVEELEREMKKLEKITRQTKEQLGVIREENRMIEGEIGQLVVEEPGESGEE